MPEGPRFVIPTDADPTRQTVRYTLEATWHRYLEQTTPEQRAAHWKAFKCGGCTIRDTCPSSPVCPAMED